MAETKFSPVAQQTIDAIDNAIQGMTDEQLGWHPEGKWSSAGILEHLSLAYARTAERMKPVVQLDKVDLRKGTIKELTGVFIVLKLGRIPSGRKAPEALLPKGESPRQVVASIRQSLSELDEVCKKCEARFGDKKKVLLHTILGPLSVHGWRRFHCVHTLHHMKQIQGLREQMNSTAKQ